MRLVADDSMCGQRLDACLTERLNDFSRSRIQTLIKDGYILLNGERVKTGARLRTGDNIDIDIPPVSETMLCGQDIALDIVYEDDSVIVVNKPKGMVVHPAPGHQTDTLVNALIYHCGDTLSGIGGVFRPGIVHRIDKDTTGLIIACKNDHAHRILADQLKRHSIERKYIALCYGGFTDDSGSIAMPIGRKRTDRRVMTVRDPVSGREAVTHYNVLESYRHSPDTLTLIECVLKTGRTHQIRVHMSSVGHPLAGDEVYGRKNDFLRGNGQYLHAAVLGFTHPVTGERLRFSAPLPEYFTKTLDKLRK